MKKIEFKEKTYRKIVIGNTEYSGKDAFKQRSPEYITSLLENELKDKTVLDLGCASGAILFNAHSLAIKNAVGVEMDHRKMDVGVEIAKNHHIKNISFYNLTIEDFFLNNKDNYDVVFCLNIIHHLPNPYYVMDKLAATANQYICLELPLKRWYTPYPQHKKIKTIFTIPLNIQDVTKYMAKFDFSLIKEIDSENTKSFIKGNRKVFLYQKNAIKYATSTDGDAKNLIIGPGSAGKTTLFYKQNFVDNGKSCAAFKYRDKHSHKSTDKVKNTLRLMLRKKQADNKFSNTQKILYLNPNYMQIKNNNSIRGLSLNFNKWVDIAKNHSTKCTVMFAPEHILSSRIIDRYQKKMGEQIDKKYLNRIANLVMDRSIHHKFLDKKIKNYIAEQNISCNINNIITFFREHYYPNVAFSYQKLFHTLRSQHIDFVVIDSSSNK